MKPVKTILHPTDFSSHSQEALRLACELAREEGARLVILHVVPRHVTWTAAASEIPKAEHYEHDLDCYRQEMKEKLERLPLPGMAIRAERLLGEGDVGAVIIRTAQNIACDLIAMGTHGWSEEGRRVLGSVAEHVTQNAPCRVLTVRVPLSEQNDAGQPAAEEVGVIL
jgi:nucleotide-binding universal stress UspA family protein